MVGREAELASCLQSSSGCAAARAAWSSSPARPASASRASSPSCGGWRGAGLAWLEGRTLSFGRTISYWPLLEIIQQDAGIDSDDAEAERWAKLAGRVSGLFGDQASEILPYLATLLSLPVPEELAPKVGHLDGEAMGRQVYRASRLFFARLAAERPLVVVFEDVHWLDGSSAALLEHLLPLIDEAAPPLLLRRRPEPDTALTRSRSWRARDYADRSTEIALQPSPRQESDDARPQPGATSTTSRPGCATPSSPRPRATPSSWRRWSAA